MEMLEIAEVSSLLISSSLYLNHALQVLKEINDVRIYLIMGRAYVHSLRF
jgi:hypothetical protein